MSNPPPPAAPPPLPSTLHHQPPHITTSTNREYRKENWTIQETLTLITAKRLDDERRSKPSTSSPSKPGELRWKWVENYCWDHGCFRSQNQCNDKWDNLLRDYKKVRHYQSQSSHHFPSYWSMDRHQRKLHNLPTNMSSEVFEAVNDVVQRKCKTHRPPQQQQQQQQQQPPPQQSFVSQPPEQLAVRTDQQVPEIEAPVTVSEESDSSETDQSSENLESETKRKKIGTIGSSIMRSASVFAQTLKSCEEKKAKRHQQVMELEQRRLQIEETRNEVNRKGITDLVAAMTNLSAAIQSLIANHYDQT
ncbi:hypothetical protein DITRI_Ditri17bG0097500 [Diplodiscus trichospermus]